MLSYYNAHWLSLSSHTTYCPNVLRDIACLVTPLGGFLRIPFVLLSFNGWRHYLLNDYIMASAMSGLVLCTVPENKWFLKKIKIKINPQYRRWELPLNYLKIVSVVCRIRQGARDQGSFLFTVFADYYSKTKSWTK